MYTSKVTIADTPSWEVISHGRGAAYEVTGKGARKGVSLFFQGTDADVFRAEYEAAENAYVKAWHNDALAERTWDDFLSEALDPFLPVE